MIEQEPVKEPGKKLEEAVGSEEQGGLGGSDADQKDSSAERDGAIVTIRIARGRYLLSDDRGVLISDEDDGGAGRGSGRRRVLQKSERKGAHEGRGAARSCTVEGEGAGALSNFRNSWPGAVSCSLTTAHERGSQCVTAKIAERDG